MFRLAIVSFLALLLTSCAQKDVAQQTPRKVSVAVAASLMLPLEEVASEFEKEHGIRVELSPASSGVLTAQIIHGAPFDLFISADAVYPKKLEESEKTVGRAETFAFGTLVLWSKKDLKGMSPTQFFSGDDVKTLSIANPDLAPFGTAAVKWLEQGDLYLKVKPKLIYGENIGSVNQFIASGAVDAALTSVSALHTPQLRQKGHWITLPPSENTRIPHVAVVIDQKHSRADTKRFLDFLLSDTAQAILAKYGYMKPEKA